MDDLYIQSFNTDMDTKELLNNNCGAEFASFYGDADRLIYFAKKGDAPMVIDGDKQFALLMLYITQMCAELGLEPDLHVLVNTAYANG